MLLHLVFFLMDILDHKLIWLLLLKTKLTTSEHMTLSVTRVTELENMDSSLVLHLLFIKRFFLFQKPNVSLRHYFRLKSLLKSLKKLLKRWNHNYPEISTFLWRKYPLWMISCNRKIFMNLYYALFIGLTENARLHVFHMLFIKCLE